MSRTRDYTVGYGRPPRHSQFEKGRSGNPKGRRKGARNLRTELEEQMAEPVLIREGGRAKKIPMRRALIKSLAALGLKGNARAIANALAMDARWLLDPQQPTPESVSEEDREILETFKELVKKGLA